MQSLQPSSFNRSRPHINQIDDEIQRRCALSTFGVVLFGHAETVAATDLHQAKRFGKHRRGLRDRNSFPQLFAQNGSSCRIEGGQIDQRHVCRSGGCAGSSLANGIA